MPRSLLVLSCLVLLPALAPAFLPAPSQHLSGHLLPPYTVSPRSPSRIIVNVVEDSAPEVKPVAPAAAAAAAKRPRREILVSDVVESKGGYMAKVTVKNFNEESHHTVITSKELMQTVQEQAGKQGGTIEEYYQAVFRFMLSKGMPLKNTEGMIDAMIFPINYFSVKQLAYFHEDAMEGIAKSLKDM